MDSSSIEALGDQLFEAYRTRTPISPLVERYPDLDIDTAYRIAQRFVWRMLEGGGTQVGKKIGATSKAVQSMLGIEQPDFGILTGEMAYNSTEIIPISQKMIQPRAEGEIAFLLKSRLMGPGVNNASVLGATEGVIACFEVVDSRIRDWKIKIQDTVADNASCGAFVLGDQIVPIQSLDLATCGAVMEKNGEIVATGAGAAALGSPVSSVAWLANELGSRGIALEAGEIVLSGSIVPLVDVSEGDHMRLTIGGLGTVSVRFS